MAAHVGQFVPVVFVCQYELTMILVSVLPQQKQHLTDGCW